MLCILTKADGEIAVACHVEELPIFVEIIKVCIGFMLSQIWFVDLNKSLHLSVSLFSFIKVGGLHQDKRNI